MIFLNLHLYNSVFFTLRKVGVAEFRPMPRLRKNTLKHLKLKKKFLKLWESQHCTLETEEIERDDICTCFFSQGIFTTLESNRSLKMCILYMQRLFWIKEILAEDDKPNKQKFFS